MTATTDAPITLTVTLPADWLLILGRLTALNDAEEIVRRVCGMTVAMAEGE